MASKNSSLRNRSRVTPYDKNLPANWTATKLRSEIAAHGIILTSRISKSALLQVYEQLSSRSTLTMGNTNEEPQGTLPVQLTAPGPSQVTELHQTFSLPDRNTLLSDLQTQECQTSLLNGTVGMVTAMQGAITSLQATVNNLLQKETQSTHQNSLEAFYNSDTRNTTAAVPNIFQHGIPADDLPHIDVVSESLKKSIVSGKYVNLAALLVPDNAFKSTESIVGLELLKQQQRDHRLDRVLSITQFYEAFGIYKHVMCEAFPQRRNELDLYEADIGEIFNHYGEIFYQYHVQFTKKAAAYMEKGIKVDWSKRHKDLFQLLIGGSKTRLCDHSSQVDHQSPFCPTQINVVQGSRQRPSFCQDQSNDRYGRQRILFKGRDL